jgi:hypothetical protein
VQDDIGELLEAERTVADADAVEERGDLASARQALRTARHVKRPLVHSVVGVEARDVLAVERESLDAGEGLAGSDVPGTESPA